MVEQVKSLQLNSKLQKVALGKMRIAQEYQRDLNPAWRDSLGADFDLDQLGYPVLSFRDSHYFVVDGQHRTAALKEFLGDGWESQSIECRVYFGLSLTKEAAMFLRLNNVKSVPAFSKFNAGVVADRSPELAVKRAVEKAGLTIARYKGAGSVNAVSTLMRIFRRSNAATLTRSVNVIYNGFGDPGLTNMVIDGMAMVCERYNGALDDQATVARLQQMRGGVGALITKAATLKKQTGQNLPTCIAATIVDTVNAGKGGKKLPAWWKE